MPLLVPGGVESALPSTPRQSSNCAASSIDINDPLAALSIKEPGRMSFLDLPGELREMIYEYVRCYDEVLLRTISHHSGKGNVRWEQTLVSTSAMARLNQQVRHEFLKNPRLFANIHCPVEYLDFEPVSFFLDCLSDEEIGNTLTATSPFASRTITIQLEFDRAWPCGPRFGSMVRERWWTAMEGDATSRRTLWSSEEFGSYKGMMRFLLRAEVYAQVERETLEAELVRERRRAQSHGASSDSDDDGDLSDVASLDGDISE
jgi:hypothetical protein